MTTWAGLECWDSSDPEARRDAEWEASWDALSEEEPPDECPCCCSEEPGACCVCSMIPARPEGGERDG